MLLRLTQGNSRLVMVFLGALWSSIKEVKAPFVFDGEHGISLQAVQVNRPHLAVRGKSPGFS